MLAHELIKKDIEIVDIHLNKHFNSRYLDNLTKKIKQEIYKKFNGKTQNKIIYIGTNEFQFVVPALIAVWELGAAVFCNDSDPAVQKLPYFQKFFDVVDLAIISQQNPNAWGDKSKILFINPNYFENLHNQVEYDITVADDAVAYYTTSSGTTSDPKLLSFNHRQTVMMAEHLKDIIVDDSNDVRPFHFKTLHHGSLFNSFALPMLSTTKIHYTGQYRDFGDKFIEKFCQNVLAYKISHFLCPYNWIREFTKVPSYNLENLTLSTIQGNTDKEMIDLFERFNVKKVVNYFGCSEVGTVFTSVTTKDNIDSYNPNRFTDLIPYLELKINDSSISIRWKDENEWFTTADKIEFVDGAYWFRGRDLWFEVGNKKIELKTFFDYVKNKIKTDQLTLVPDYLKKSLYLASYTTDISTEQLLELNADLLTEFGEEFTISKCNRFDTKDILFGMKVNGPLLLFLFRNLEK